MFHQTIADLHSEKQALLDFAATVHHGHKVNWYSSTSICTSWVGVTCSSNGSHVASVMLPGVGLRGSLPPNTIGFIAMELNSQNRAPFSIKIWPPSQKTRQTLMDRMTNNLTTKSIFTQKYGTLDQKEAEENAKRIEDVTFATENLHYKKEPDGDGGFAIQVYAKECSNGLLDVLKRGPG
ncbi:WPP domain [Sesbania bispinosa]|nr:WPP domain [Sesbania bispinosa]